MAATLYTDPRGAFHPSARSPEMSTARTRVDAAAATRLATPVCLSAGIVVAKLKHSVSREFWASWNRRAMTEVHVRIRQFKGNRVRSSGLTSYFESTKLIALDGAGGHYEALQYRDYCSVQSLACRLYLSPSNR